MNSICSDSIIPDPIHTYMHACIHTYIHTCIHTHMHSSNWIRFAVTLLFHIQYIHTYITHIHTHTHAYTHTCTLLHGFDLQRLYFPQRMQNPSTINTHTIYQFMAMDTHTHTIYRFMAIHTYRIFSHSG
jgi:hypothetical protein